MYSTCLYCTKDLGTNEILETLPIGRRVAFDARQGRLWVVCRSCAKWNLVPFDTRLETIDDCDRIFRDTGTRYSTDNIGLARVREGLDLVRIGAPLRPEFAAWRYGRSFMRRRALGIAAGGAGLAVAGAITLAMAPTASSVFAALLSGAYTLNGGWHLGLGRMMRVRVADPVSGKRRTIGKFDLGQIVVVVEGEGRLRVRARKEVFRRNKYQVDVGGTAAMQLLARVLPKLNVLTGSSDQVRAATEQLERFGSREGLVGQIVLASISGAVATEPLLENRLPLGTPIVGGEWPLAALPATARLMLEMAVHEERERVWLNGELALLEREWREAEELATIVDSLALPS